MAGQASQTRAEGFGMGLIISSSLFFSAMVVCIRMGSEHFSPVSLLFYRMLVQTLTLLPFWEEVGWNRQEPLLKKARIHVFRSGFGLAAMFCLFQSLHFLPVGLSTVLGMTNVIWVATFAWIILGEKVNGKQVAFGVCILSGIALCLWQPAYGDSGWRFHATGVVFALANGFFTGCAFTFMRQLRRGRSAKEITFYFGLAGLLVTTPLFCLNPEWPQSTLDWTLVAIVAFAGSTGQVLLSAGFKYTSALTATLTNYLQTPLNILAGAIVLSELPPLPFYFGVIFVFLGLFGLTWTRTRAHEVV